ncbi:LysR family transcriptional regulator [Neotabrizicola shimadae]|uniref:LysR family transcriptional regulator n=1 Tax=Neotabrizicola shimadae TaxID=2807096 RepID=A0A8G1EEM3_9RHOB|nr:LysR family transcriptional regulator [Neotabrizicola shimadae]QYZ71488.1 LysR family transcriptional regulator [Neotabrizicola shimadae]
MRPDLTALQIFIEVARDLSFTNAAARLGLAPSSVSRTIRDLEDRIGVRLLTRTTRSVSLTEAGLRLLDRAAPRLEEISAELAALTDLGLRPSGLVRITCSEQAAYRVLWPKLRGLMKDFPQITVELFIDHSFTDIAARNFDAGVRLGDSVEKDMVAVRIGPDSRLIAVGAPRYFAERPIPLRPQDLTEQSCINLRLGTRGDLYAWEFERSGEKLRVRVDGPWIFNTVRIPRELGSCSTRSWARVPRHRGHRFHGRSGSFADSVMESVLSGGVKDFHQCFFASHAFTGER